MLAVEVTFEFNLLDIEFKGSFKLNQSDGEKFIFSPKSYKKEIVIKSLSDRINITDINYEVVK